MHIQSAVGQPDGAVIASPFERSYAGYCHRFPAAADHWS